MKVLVMDRSKNESFPKNDFAPGFQARGEAHKLLY